MAKRKVRKKYSNGRVNGWYKKPIQDWDEINKLLNIPGAPGLMIKIGLYWGLRVNEIVSLKWKDLMTSPGRVVSQFAYRQAKQSNIRQTSVNRHIKVNPDLASHIADFYADELKPPLERYVFYPTRKMSLDQHVTAKSAREWIKKAAREARCRHADIDFHQLRRTFVFRYYERNGLAMTLAMTGHTSPQTLLTYIGIVQEDVLKGYDNLYDDQYLPLITMYEKGMVDINMDLITRKKPSEWQQETVARLMAYTSLIDEANELAKILLLPYRAQIARR